MTLILLLWAIEFRCKWLQNNDLTGEIIEESTLKLTTPLGLREFACASADCSDKTVLRDLIKKKSKKSKEAFGEEVAGMTKEMKLFLTLVCILRPVNPSVVEELYDNYCQTLRLNFEENSFESLEKKLSSRVVRLAEAGQFDFTHPSYEEGVVASWSNVEAKSLALKILNRLVFHENPRVRGSCGYVLVKYFEDLSFQDKAKDMIIKILEDKKTATRLGVAEAVQTFSKNIPITLRFECLNRMVKDHNRFVRRYAVETAAYGFSELTLQDALKIISDGLEDRAADVRLAAVRAARMNMKKTPTELVKKALVCNEELCNFSNWNIYDQADTIYRIFKEEAEKNGII